MYQVFFGYPKYSSVTKMLFDLGLPSFTTLIHNSKVSFASRQQAEQALSDNNIVRRVSWVCFASFCLSLFVCSFFCIVVCFMCMSMDLSCLKWMNEWMNEYSMWKSKFTFRPTLALCVAWAWPQMGVACLYSSPSWFSMIIYYVRVFLSMLFEIQVSKCHFLDRLVKRCTG